MLLRFTGHRPAVVSSVAGGSTRRLRATTLLPLLLPRSITLLRIRSNQTSHCACYMENATLLSSQRSQASTRMCIVKGFSTELLEMNSKEPSLQVLLVPGNPGIVAFYRDFIETVYEQLKGSASVTAIAHISHSAQDLEHGRMFSLQEQIDHKVHFIEQELQNSEKPIVLIGHSIGAYICLEVFKRLPQKVKCMIGLVQMLLIKKLLGQSWSTTAIDATCTHLLQYHTMRNMLFMAKTEFDKLSEEPDWQFMKRKRSQISLLFGIDDHWGPLSHYEEVSRQVPGLALSIEREGHTHAFSCTEAGSLFVGRHVASVIKSQIAN